MWPTKEPSIRSRRRSPSRRVLAPSSSPISRQTPVQPSFSSARGRSWNVVASAVPLPKSCWPAAAMCSCGVVDVQRLAASGQGPGRPSSRSSTPRRPARGGRPSPPGRADATAAHHQRRNRFAAVMSVHITPRRGLREIPRLPLGRGGSLGRRSLLDHGDLEDHAALLAGVDFAGVDGELPAPRSGVEALDERACSWPCQRLMRVA